MKRKSMVEKPGTLGGYDYGTASDAHDFCAAFLAHHPRVAFHDVARVSRWRGYMIEEFEELKAVASYAKYMTCAAAVEKYFGKSAIEIALHNMTKSRGVFGFGNVRQRLDYTLDVDFENAGTRKRNVHERQTASFYLRGVFDIIGIVYVPNGKKLVTFIKRFWRAGDHELTDAIRRAVRAACS